ncbi:MAG: amidohydrolase family protein, partial [Verrucomicrobia bacterium]|nr:amidohydrolase family protein [Verrucomicrobiota bacterium]
AAARRLHLPLAVHVAESAAEFEMFRHARGPMFDWFKTQRDCSDCGRASPVQHLDRCGVLGPRTLAVHANYLAPGDADLLARRRVNIAHCPTSHAYFDHQSFPLERLLRAGVNVCLGTDSLGSTLKPRGKKLELDLRLEMRTLAADRPGLAPTEVLRMATINGATALGLRHLIGEISPRARADFVAIAHSGSSAAAAEAIIQSDLPVAASMIDGEWAVAPGVH